jgi:transcriptional regulator with XRE-family HTH domain
MPAELDTLAKNLATNLRWVRERRSLTQSQLARLCGVPRSTIANIETGAANPTLAVLAQLALALQLPFEELLGAPRARCQLYKKGSLPVVPRGKSGKTRVHKLLPHAITGMEIDRMELGPEERMAGVPHRPGTHEYLYCERGAIVLWVAGQKFELTVGDVAAFPGDQAHSYQNPLREPSVGFSVVTLAGLPESLPAR